jgi:hypothetical protein
MISAQCDVTFHRMMVRMTAFRALANMLRGALE